MDLFRARASLWQQPYTSWHAISSIGCLSGLVLGKRAKTNATDYIENTFGVSVRFHRSHFTRLFSLPPPTIISSSFVTFQMIFSLSFSSLPPFDVKIWLIPTSWQQPAVISSSWKRMRWAEVDAFAPTAIKRRSSWISHLKEKEKKLELLRFIWIFFIYLCLLTVLHTECIKFTLSCDAEGIFTPPTSSCHLFIRKHFVEMKIEFRFFLHPSTRDFHTRKRHKRIATTTCVSWMNSYSWADTHTFHMFCIALLYLKLSEFDQIVG